MSDLKADKAHSSPAASPGHAHGADDHAVDFTAYVRRCAVIFLAVLCTTSAMIFTSYSHLGWTLKAALIIAIAVVNAFLVAGYLMHLLSEKKLIFTVLAFTVCFFIGLMGLTIWAMGDFPSGTAFH